MLAIMGSTNICICSPFCTPRMARMASSEVSISSRMQTQPAQNRMMILLRTSPEKVLTAIARIFIARLRAGPLP